MSASAKVWLNGSLPDIDDDDLNGFNNENIGLIEGSNQTASAANNDQTHEAVARYASYGNVLTASGTGDAIILSLIGNNIMPTTLNGMEVRWQGTADNTGATTINVPGVGVLGLRDSVGVALSGGTLETGSFYAAVFNSTANQWWLVGPTLEFKAEAFPDFADAVTAAAGSELVVSTNIVIASNITVSGLTLRFVQGGNLDPNTGVTVTLDCDIDAGLFEIFDATALGLIRGNFNGKAVNVAWFGIVPGVDADTKMNKAAVTSRAAAVPLDWNGGIYLQSENTDYTTDGNSFNWRGLGMQQTTIRVVGGGVTKMIEFSEVAPGDSDFVARSQITGMTLDGTALADFGISGFAEIFSLRDVRLTRFTDKATDLGQAFASSFENVHVDNNADGIVIINSGSNNDITIFNCKIFLNSGVGIIGGSGTAFHITHSAIETNGECGIFLASDIKACSISNNYFESNANTGYTFTSPAETIKAEVIANGGGILNLSFGTPIDNLSVENNFVSPGGAETFIYAGGIRKGVIKNNFTTTAAEAALIATYGNDSGSLPFGNYSDLEISNNQNFGHTYTGTHTASSANPVLTDAAASFKVNLITGALVENIDDGSFAEVTGGTGTTAIGTLAGGQGDEWDTGDSYRIIIPEINIKHVPVSGTGTAIAQGGEFGNIKYSEASVVDAVLVELNQWTVVSSVATSLWERSSTKFTNNPHLRVWDLSRTADAGVGSSDRLGFTIDMDDYEHLKGKFGEFSAYVKQPFSGDGNIQLVVNGITPIAATENANSKFVKQTVVFRFPMVGTLQFGVVKVGESGTVQIAAPKIIELGSLAGGSLLVNEPVTKFKGSAAPTTGTWETNDVVERVPQVVGQPRDFVNTAGGSPGTFVNGANL